LLERYLATLDRDPWLVVPNRMDVQRVEHDLLKRKPALLAGRIGTFDDLFETIGSGAEGGNRVASDVQPAIAVRRAAPPPSSANRMQSPPSQGFSLSLLGALDEIGGALLDGAQLEGDLAALSSAYESELERLGLDDRTRVRRRALDRLESDLEAWR